MDMSNGGGHYDNNLLRKFTSILRNYDISDNYDYVLQIYKLSFNGMLKIAFTKFYDNCLTFKYNIVRLTSIPEEIFRTFTDIKKNRKKKSFSIVQLNICSYV